MTPHWRRLRPAAVLLGVVAAAASMGGVAQAHPFGDPQTAEIHAEGNTVHIRWQAAPDDLSTLAIELRVVESGRTFVYQDGALVPEESDPTDIDALVAAPETVDYLLEHIRVSAGGQDCAGSAGSLDGLGVDGAELAFACAAPVTAATVEISTLTDLHEAYRTLATGPDSQGHIYTLDAGTADWTFDPTAAPAGDRAGLGRSALVQLSAVVAAVAAAAAVVTLLVRRRKPAPAPAGPSTDHPHP